MSNAAELSCLRHSFSVLTIFGTDTTPCRTPASENCTIVTISVGPAGTDSAFAGWRLTKRQTARPARAEAHTEKNALRSKPFDDSPFVTSDRNMKTSKASVCSLDFPSGRKFQEDLKDRKSTRLNSSHLGISYAVFCLKKKINKKN